NSGSTYRGISRMMGRNMKWSGIVTEYEPNRKWNKDISSEGLTIKESVTYNPVDGGTTFTLMYDLSAGGFLKLLLPVIAGSMRKEARKSLENLQNILEE
ncbi:MAG: SRPBCC family protein, partial [Syntrophaceae bacterium]|nr:SRPBCC family protein [Syntrophaceae bacterium]